MSDDRTTDSATGGTTDHPSGIEPVADTAAKKSGGGDAQQIDDLERRAAERLGLDD
ncbi:hypothetical protein [Cellulomonas hominis]|uniref:hypothetical protein n=1 Tax=Cellulomonas hominis TaxID=156981 RepID=UPI001B99E941|nr:hypothetical protein [Cellulomonas hominis]VTR78227.1 hypothetical protein CHMI_03003 [Cellulomonas hominis]